MNAEHGNGGSDLRGPTVPGYAIPRHLPRCNRLPEVSSAGLVIMERDCIIQNQIDNRPAASKKLGADLHPPLMPPVQHASADAASDSTLGALRRNGFGTGDSLLAPPSGKSFCRALTLGERGDQ